MADSTDRGSVLLVDSDDDTRELYASAFAAAGWAAGGAESGAIALAIALERTPTLVVTELRLPGIDGIELIRILRRDPHTLRVRVVVVSADVLPTVVERAYTAGADLVLAKPCLPDVLVARSAALVAAADAAWVASAPLDAVGAPPRAAARPHDTACPLCGTRLSLKYTHSTRVGRRVEQWLHLICPRGCGRFEYRERTRKLRQTS